MTFPGLNNLENLVQTKALNKEPVDEQERAGMLAAAETSLSDARQTMISLQSRFTLAYNAGHSAALSALRFRGYRSNTRYTVFQSLAHTLGYQYGQWGILDKAHAKRNKSEYEGDIDLTERFVEELIETVEKLIADAKAL